jgi:hypothetical protein
MNRFTRRHDSLRRPAITEGCCCRHRHTKHPHNAILPDTDRPRPSERTQREAAQYLQISVRTLQRHHTAGRITGRYLQTGMCQVVFEQAELDRYKQAVGSASPPPRAKQKIAASPIAPSSPITSPIKPATPPPTAAASETSALTAEVARLCALLETLLIVIADQSATSARATTHHALQFNVRDSLTQGFMPRSPSQEHDQLCR